MHRVSSPGSGAFFRRLEAVTMGKSENPVWRWLQSTSNRTYVFYPIAIIAYELLLHRGGLEVQPWAIPLMVWGYLQYKLAGRYRLRQGGGGPGLSVPPLRLCTAGPYRWVRNPMYLGHLIFLAGLALTFKSWAGAGLMPIHILWFNPRVPSHETRLPALSAPDTPP